MAPKLVESAQAASAKAKAASKAAAKRGISRHLGRRHTEEQVERALQEHFPGCSTVFVHERRVDGTTLFEAVLEAKRACKSGGKKLGSQFWADLKTKFNPPVADSAFIAKDPSQAVQAPLLRALTVATSANTTQRSREPLLAFCQTASSINQKEFVGLCRHLVKEKPMVNNHSCSLCIEAMRLVQRLKLSESFPTEVAGLAELFDQCLVTSFSQLRKERVTTASWWAIYKDIAALVVDSGSVDRILGETASWQNVAKELQVVTGTSMIGEKMFAWANTHVIGEKIGQGIENRLRALGGDQPITEQVFKTFWEQTMTEGEELGATKHLSEKREIKLNYAGIPYTITVSSFIQEAQMRWANFVKQRNAGGKLRAMWWEKGILRVPTATNTFDDSLLGEFKKARDTASDMLEELPKDGRALVGLMRCKVSILQGIDKTWALDMEVAEEMHGPGGREQMQKAILECMSKEGSLKGLDHSCQLLAQLADGELYRVLDSTGQKQLDAVREILEGLKHGKSPNTAHMKSSEFMIEVCSCLPTYCTYTFLAEGAKESTTKVGKEAVNMILQICVAKKDSGQLSFEDLHEVHTYGWLLDPEGQNVANDLTAHLLDSVSTAKKRPIQHGAGASSSSSGQKAAKKQEASDVMSLFG